MELFLLIVEPRNSGNQHVYRDLSVHKPIRHLIRSMYPSDRTRTLAGAATESEPQDDAAARAEDAAERRAKIFRVTVVCLGFTALFATALGIDRVIRSAPPEMTTAERIKADMTTRSRIPLADGKTCRAMVFDRSTGDLIESVTGLCSSMEPQTKQERAQHDFNWGGRR